MKMENISDSSFWTYQDISDSYAFERIDMIYWRDLLLVNWKFPFYTSLVYVAIIFGLQKLLENRAPFHLKTPLVLWNAALGVFSVVGFVRTVPERLEYFSSPRSLFYDSICARQYTTPVTAFWAVAFVLSKYVELGDTLFIVLRKKPIKVTQWFHHSMALIIPWLTVPSNEPIGRWCIVLNYGVHSLIYPYFAMKMAGINVPKGIARMITTAQFVQMIIGFYINFSSLAIFALGYPCYRTPTGIAAYTAAYTTFIILFGQLFYDAVLKTSKSKVQVRQKKVS